MTRHHRIAVVSIAMLVGTAALGAAAVAQNTQVRTVVSDQVIEALEQLDVSSAPRPRSSDERVSSTRYASRDSCATVQADYAGALTTSTFGWVSVVELPTGPAAVIGAPADPGCAYETTNVESLSVKIASVDGLEKFRAFTNVACFSAPLAGFAAEFIGPDGAPMVVQVASTEGFDDVGSDDPASDSSVASDTGDEVVVDTPAAEQALLMVATGRYSSEGDGMNPVVQLDGTLLNHGGHFEFRSGDTSVSARCTIVDPAGLIPKVSS